MSSKKKPKFKKRRSISREELFGKKVEMENWDLLVMDSRIREAIPNLVEREKYIDALIEKFSEE